MPEFSSATYSATDANNTSASPDGAPEGMAPSGVNNTIRAHIGATKRFWQRIQSGGGTFGGATNAYTITYTPALAAYVSGERYSFVANADNTGSATLNINGLGAKTLRKITSSGKVALASGDIKNTQPVTVEYDGTDMVMVTPVANLSAGTVTQVSTGSGLTGGPITASGTVSLDVAGLTEDTSPDAQSDFVAAYDASAAANRKMKTKNLGRIVQRVDDEEAVHSTSTATMPTGDTAPTNTDGAEILSLSITPRSSSDTVLLSVSVIVGSGSVRDFIVTILRGTTVIAAAKQYVNGIATITFNVEDAPATTSSTTYSARAGVTAGATWSINGDGSSRVMGGKAVSSLSAMEYAA
jgi:hypothetical protein